MAWDAETDRLAAITPALGGDDSDAEEWCEAWLELAIGGFDLAGLVPPMGDFADGWSKITVATHGSSHRQTQSPPQPMVLIDQTLSAAAPEPSYMLSVLLDGLFAPPVSPSFMPDGSSAAALTPALGHDWVPTAPATHEQVAQTPAPFPRARAGVWLSQTLPWAAAGFLCALALIPIMLEKAAAMAARPASAAIDHAPLRRSVSAARSPGYRGRAGAGRLAVRVSRRPMPAH